MGVLHFRRGKGIGRDLRRALLRVLGKALGPVLLHRGGLGQDVLEVLEHLRGHALLEHIAGLHMPGRLLPLAGGADFVHHVLAGGDGGVGNIPCLQVIALGRDGYQKQHQQHQRAHGDHIDAFGAGGPKSRDKVAPGAAVLFSPIGMFFGHHDLSSSPNGSFRRLRKLLQRSAPDRGAPRRSGSGARWRSPECRLAHPGLGASRFACQRAGPSG